MKIRGLILGVLGGMFGLIPLLSAGTIGEDAVAPVLAIPKTLEEQEAASRQRSAAIAQAKAMNDFIPRDPWRAMSGKTNYIKADGVEFCGKVMDVTKDGVRIEGAYGDLFGTSYIPSMYSYDDFFVANFPFEVVNDQVIPQSEHLMAWYVGTYTYSTVNGSSRTIKKLNYGIPCDPPAELIKQQQEAAAARALAEKKKADQGQVNAVHWLQTQATNGSASAQCSLGIHYLNGQGCETNREQAIYWLKKAAEQGDTEASQKLAGLNP